MALGYFGIVGWAAALARAATRLAALSRDLGAAGAHGLRPRRGRRAVAVRRDLRSDSADPAHVPAPLLLVGRARRSGARRSGARPLREGPRPRAAAGVGSRRRCRFCSSERASCGFLHLRPELTAEGALGFQKRQLAIAAGLLVSAAGLALLAGARSGVYVAGLSALVRGGSSLPVAQPLPRLSANRSSTRRLRSSRFLRAQPPPFRVAGAGTALFPNTNVFAGVEDIRTHDAGRTAGLRRVSGRDRRLPARRLLQEARVISTPRPSTS